MALRSDGHAVSSTAGGEPKPRYAIQHESLVAEWMRQTGFDIETLPFDRPEDWPEILHKAKCVGVRCRTHAIVKCADVASGLPKPGTVGRRR